MKKYYIDYVFETTRENFIKELLYSLYNYATENKVEAVKRDMYWMVEHCLTNTSDKSSQVVGDRNFQVIDWEECEIVKFLYEATYLKVGGIVGKKLNNYLLLWVEKTSDEDFCAEILINEEENSEVFSDVIENLELTSKNIEEVAKKVVEIMEISRKDIVEKYFKDEE